MSRSPVPSPAESPASRSSALPKSREPPEGGGSGPARPDDDAPPASPPATESARVRSPLVSFNSATRRVNRSPGVRPARAGWEHRVGAARRRDVRAHLFCLGLVRVAAKRRSVATPAGDAAARPELANIPDVSLSPRDARSSLSDLRAPRLWSRRRESFFKRKDEAWARKPCLFGGSNFGCANWLSLSAYALRSWARNDDSLFLTTGRRNQPMWQVESWPPQRRVPDETSGFPGQESSPTHPTGTRLHLEDAPQTSPRGRRRAARRGKGVEARARR